MDHRLRYWLQRRDHRDALALVAGRPLVTDRRIIGVMGINLVVHSIIWHREGHAKMYGWMKL